MSAVALRRPAADGRECAHRGDQTQVGGEGERQRVSLQSWSRTGVGGDLGWSTVRPRPLAVTRDAEGPCIDEGSWVKSLGSGHTHGRGYGPMVADVRSLRVGIHSPPMQGRKTSVTRASRPGMGHSVPSLTRHIHDPAPPARPNHAVPASDESLGPSLDAGRGFETARGVRPACTQRR